MNKQELIAELKKGQQNIKRGISDGYNAFYNGIDTVYSIAIGLAKKLDEPKKVVVPRSVAEMIEIYKGKEISLAYLMRYFKGWHNKVNKGTMDSEALAWIVNNLEEFLDAWIHGYEVEKEQLYYVKLPEIGYMRFGKKYFYSTDKEDAKRYTENQIKAIDERYWPFAVKVDGE
ncbi:DUF1642 domain-containing protein [Enterococcus faecalis]|uniref:DUF1642 domain-containing protein n=1 Tax=Enterococcus faecalis TaxID=1351 RepID=UPI001363EC9A|nr:DUF1642 domain-containing protein [Enterococcus faecalis]QHN67045.1 DUF1642 domain-containing protein [Enterococcus faecalis]QUE60136.1 DUF1642 domain-containing protein [Enterococcus faecalis]